MTSHAPRLTRRQIVIMGIVGLSLVLSLARAFPFSGSLLSLILVVGIQVGLSGYLLLEILGVMPRHWALAPAWILVAGLAVIVPLGSVFRLFGWPLPYYVALLHGLLLVMALRLPPNRAAWGLELKAINNADRLVLVGLLVLCTVITLAVGLSRNGMRFAGWPDETEFISKINWMVVHPYEPGRYTIQTSVGQGDVDARYLTDGLTFNHAVWAWIAQIPAPTLIYDYLTPLFLWLVPLATYGLGLILTGERRFATYMVIALTVVGSLSIDHLGYETFFGFGDQAFSGVRTLRTFSMTLLVPIGQQICLEQLQRPRRRLLVFLTLAAITLVLIHPQGLAMVLVTILGAVLAFSVLQKQPLRAQLGLLLALILPLLIPFVQGMLWKTQLDRLYTSNEGFGFLLTLQNVPLLGETYIVHPALLLSSPILLVALVLGLTMPLWRRQRPETYLGAGSAVMMILFLFTPGTTALFGMLVQRSFIGRFLLLLPVAVIYGSALDSVILLLRKRQPAYERLAWGAILLAFLVVYAEPLPIPASPRDQIRSADAIQGAYLIRDSERTLLAQLATDPIFERTEPVVVLAPDRSANFFVEELPNVLTPGGRSWYGGNLASAGVERFYARAGDAVFLDTDDLAFLEEWQVDLIIIEADQPRAAMLRLNPARFDLRYQTGGLWVFEVKSTAANAADALFAQMNQQIEASLNPRLAGELQALYRAGDPAFGDLVDAWQRHAHPDDPLVRYGLANALLLAGDDAAAAQELGVLVDSGDAGPQVWTLLARTRRYAGDMARAVDALMDWLQSSEPEIRLAAAALAASPEFVSVLDAPQMAQVAAALTAERSTLEILLDTPEALRSTAILLATQGHTAEASALLNLIPFLHQYPEDVVSQARFALAAGEIDQALAILQPYTDPDWYFAAAHVHPDRWEPNIVEGAYHLLQGQIDQQQHADDSARQHFEIAARKGYEVAGLAGLAAIGADMQLGDFPDCDLWQTILAHEAQPTRDSAQQVQQLLAAAGYSSPAPDSDLRTVGWLATAGQHLPGLLRAYPIGDTAVGFCAQLGGDYAPFRAGSWAIKVVDADDYQVYGQRILNTPYAPGVSLRWCDTVTLNSPPPAFEAARVILQAIGTNELVHYEEALLPVTLNPQHAREEDIEHRLADNQFGAAIQLRGYTVGEFSTDRLVIDLFWRTETALAADWQVFVQVFDADGTFVATQDNAPAEGRYPTSQWEPLQIVGDHHELAFTPPLASGTYTLRTGFYSLADLQRLTVTASTLEVTDNSLSLGTFEVASP